ncbi:hypothetical protein J6590_036121 [Homalodisca vitripennis]|nr:hypothetical protein J6590_036121 [Homalodisca vitripennis]
MPAIAIESIKMSQPPAQKYIKGRGKAGGQSFHHINYLSSIIHFRVLLPPPYHLTLQTWVRTYENTRYTSMTQLTLDYKHGYLFESIQVSTLARRSGVRGHGRLQIDETSEIGVKQLLRCLLGSLI